MCRPGRLGFACVGSASKKETGGTVTEKESDSTFPPPAPEGKEGRAFIYISFESGRPVITAAALAISSSASPLSRSLSIFSVSLGLLSFFFAIYFLSLCSLAPTSIQLPASTPTTQTPSTDTSPGPPLAGPLAGRIIKVPEGDGRNESRCAATDKDEEEEEDAASSSGKRGRRVRGREREREAIEVGKARQREVERGGISGRGCYGANNRRLKRKNKGLAVHHRRL